MILLSVPSRTATAEFVVPKSIPNNFVHIFTSFTFNLFSILFGSLRSLITKLNEFFFLHGLLSFRTRFFKFSSLVIDHLPLLGAGYDQGSL